MHTEDWVYKNRKKMNNIIPIKSPYRNSADLVQRMEDIERTNERLYEQNKALQSVIETKRRPHLLYLGLSAIVVIIATLCQFAEDQRAVGVIMASVITALVMLALYVGGLIVAHNVK